MGEFVGWAGVPAVFFTASGRPPAVELAAFVDAARAGGVIPADVPPGAVASREAALVLATADAAPDAPRSADRMSSWGPDDLVAAWGPGSAPT